LYIGIDLGVSFIKFALFNEANVLSVTRIPAPTSTHQSGYKHETDPKYFFELIKFNIDEIIDLNPEVKGVFFSTQMHGFVLFDEKTNIVSNYISWKDRRSEHYFINGSSALEFLSENIPDLVLKRTGMPLRSGLPSVNMFVLNSTEGINSEMVFGTIADYIVSKLTKTGMATSLTNAAGSGLFNLEDMEWNYELVGILGMNANILPRLIQGGIKQPVGLYRGIDVFVPIGDQQAAVYGLEEELSTNVICNIATGSQATVVSKHLKFGQNFQTRPFVNESYLLTIPFIPAGRVVNSLVTFFESISNELLGNSFSHSDIWVFLSQYINSLELTGSTDEELLVNTDFIGSFSNAGGSILQITENNFFLKDLVLGFFKDIVTNHLKAIEHLSKANDISSITLSGGISQKLQIIKKLFKMNSDLPVNLSVVGEDSLNGLRMLLCNKVHSW